MNQHTNEHYDLEIPEVGLDYDILDQAFNPTTKSFINNSGVKAGMHVLDVGSGSGIMTHYLASLVGPQGHVVSIDNSAKQLACAKRYCDQNEDKNVTFKELSVYEIDKLNETFDLIYCRFVLHHIHSPRLAIRLFFQALNQGGKYIAEEGIISAAFSYPPSNAWQYHRAKITSPNEEQDGLNRDGEFGMKLFYWMRKSGFTISQANLVQPLLLTSHQKMKLLAGHDAYKNTALNLGQSEAEWSAQRDALLNLAQDDFSIAGFYQSCQVCGVK